MFAYYNKAPFSIQSLHNTKGQIKKICVFKGFPPIEKSCSY